MDSIELEARYLVVSHNQSERPYRIVGSAFKKPGDDYYTLYLRLLPGIPFFIVPHRDRCWEYLIFSGRGTKSDGSSRFFCKIGSGVCLSQNDSIELHVPDLRQVYYLKLEPQDYHYSHRCAKTAATAA